MRSMIADPCFHGNMGFVYFLWTCRFGYETTHFKPSLNVFFPAKSSLMVKKHIKLTLIVKKHVKRTLKINVFCFSSKNDTYTKSKLNPSP